MSTILPKEPVVTDRESVILSNAERRHLRRKLKGTVEIAREALKPGNQLRQYFNRKASDASRAAGSAAKIATNNAPLLGAIGLSALLFAARRPISNWISRLRKSKTRMPDGE